MAERADALIGRVFIGPVVWFGLPVSFLLIIEQARSRLGWNIVLIKESQEEVDKLLVGLFAESFSQSGRVGSSAKIFGGSQRQRQVLAEEQRLAVEPGRASVPALDRRRMKKVLTEGLERGRQGDGLDSPF